MYNLCVIYTYTYIRVQIKYYKLIRENCKGCRGALNDGWLRPAKILKRSLP